MALPQPKRVPYIHAYVTRSLLQDMYASCQEHILLLHKGTFAVLLAAVVLVPELCQKQVLRERWC